MLLLYYGLGILPSIFFGLRFFLQWIKSERKKRSTIDPLFWKLSLAGNCLLGAHYFIQLQYPFLLLQVINAFIAWRNLDFFKSQKKSFTFASLFLLSLLSIITVAFSFQHPARWLSIPAAFDKGEVSLFWHLLGITGGIFFGARFWLQWIETEKTGVSTLNKHFWILSIVGSVIALIYFVKIADTISILNYSCGLIPYIRNLMLYDKKSKVGH